MPDMVTLGLWLLVVILAFTAWRRNPEHLAQGLRLGLDQLVMMLPRIFMAILMAGFAGTLLPTGPIAQLIGPESGFKGLLIATLTGAMVPAGPMVSFPIILVLQDAGAGLPQLVAFLPSWSVIACHRVLMFEFPLMGWRFVANRMLSSLILPFVAGGLTMIAVKLFHITVHMPHTPTP